MYIHRYRQNIDLNLFYPHLSPVEHKKEKIHVPNFQNLETCIA